MYYSTNAESWLIQEYEKRGITSASTLASQRLSKAFNIQLFSAPQTPYSFYDEEDGMIMLDITTDAMQQRKDFFHEFSHVLLHAGDQRSLPESLIDYQESQARWFSLYAAMPYHILQGYLDQEPAVIARAFGVPLSMVKERLQQIQNRQLVNKVDKIGSQLPEKSAGYNPREWSADTRRVMAQLQKQTGKGVYNHVGLQHKY
ncbi:ImmA/IrrE family metallo-endopeptidase [Alkalicoccus chagannorensis]|uniref:ImmA/IrrE family metallo-endopeptidase n=1 Tax=Alkalicoccus chagannorensis TaxID=427072 RepID=UPI0006854AD1|nr:ImmA/IrrE family metallo-endopeptidase [Alkalicoccus chagannorensis]